MSPKPLECVVLIDDEFFDLKYNSRVIAKSGLARDIKTFSMAEDALAWFRETDRNAIDLVLLDTNMPRVDGFELLEAACAEFGNEFEKLVVVMVTTSMDKRDLARANEFTSVRGYVQKPLLPERFREIAELV